MTDKLHLSTPYGIFVGGRGVSKTALKRENNLRVTMPRIYWATEAELRRVFKSEQNFKKFIDEIQSGGYTQIMLKRKKNEI